jgi:hypothetical protein
MVRAKLKQRMAAGWSWIAGMPSRVPVLKKLYFLLHGK